MITIQEPFFFRLTITSQTQERLSDQGRKAVFGLFNKIQDDCYNHETLLSLFDTYVKCILNYGCEVWGQQIY
jgi:hypothetical protein